MFNLHLHMQVKSLKNTYSCSALPSVVIGDLGFNFEVKFLPVQGVMSIIV